MLYNCKNNILLKKELELPEHFILYGIRQCLICIYFKKDPTPILRQKYLTKKLENLVKPIHNIIKTTFVFSTQPIEINNLCCKFVNKIEIDILKAIYLAQNGDDNKCIDCLYMWLPCFKVEDVFRNVVEVSSSLIYKNYLFPPREEYKKVSKNSYSIQSKYKYH